FLGFGVPGDVVSWGSMLNEAQNELILGKWWQLAAAGTAMAVLGTAFSLFTDALRGAPYPKLKGPAGAGDAAPGQPIRKWKPSSASAISGSPSASTASTCSRRSR